MKRAWLDKAGVESGTAIRDCVSRMQEACTINLYKPRVDDIAGSA